MRSDEEDEPTSDPDNRSAFVGLRAAAAEGWFLAQQGLMFPGFPIGPADVVADIGCGDGGPALFCARAGARVFVTDIDEDAIANARRRLEAIAPDRVTAIVSDADPVPLPDAGATRVVCMEVVEHVDDPDRLLDELWRITAPGGLLLIACPDPRAERVQQAVAPELYFQKPNHVRIIAHDELIRMVKRVGYVVERVDTYGFFQAVWWSMFWATGRPLDRPHPVLESWAATWDGLLTLPDGENVQRALDRTFPKSQLVIARRPERR